MLLDRVKQMLTEKFPEEKISCKTDERNIVTLQGECSDWNTLINIGHAAAAVEGVRNVVSEMTAKGVTIRQEIMSRLSKRARRSESSGRLTW